MKTTITTTTGHDLKAGDIITVDMGKGKFRRLLEFFKRPRVTEITECTDTTMTLSHRRMTWSEWRRHLWGQLTGRWL